MEKRFLSMSSSPASPRVAIVTGASSGYGVGIARALSDRGFSVFITGRRADKLTAIAAEIGAVPLVADASSPEDWDRVVAAATRVTGRIDVLVNNAGSGGPIKPVAELSDADIASVLALNLTGAIYGCRRVAPLMSAQGDGVIVNISSICAKYSWPGWTIYSAAKAGLERFGKGLYTELRPHGVRVTTLTPSWGTTEFTEASGIPGQPPEVVAQCTKPAELGRIVADIVDAPSHLEILEMTVLPLVQDISPL